MKERPILFSGAMVRAILDGSKTQTRRVMRPQAEYWEQTGGYHYPLDKKPYRGAPVGRVPAIDYFRCPYGQPGDHLWVRETWNCIDTGRLTQRQDWVRYRATDGDEMYWRPSIFMPRWASRITLEVTGVRVERVQDISEEDAWAEGVDRGAEPIVSARYSFGQLWNTINEKRGFGWEVNPWCWCVTFKRVTP